MSTPSNPSEARSSRLLLVDDDARLSSMLEKYLGARGFEVSLCADLGCARKTLANESFDVVVLDVMLPDGNGLDFCRELGSRRSFPVLVLSAQGETSDRIVGLELGADDYLAKPFDPGELVARLRALGRRRRFDRLGRLGFRDLEIDLDARRVRIRGEPAVLTAQQYDLLVELATNAGRVLSRDRLAARVKGEALGPYDRSIDIQISRIRAVLEEDPRRPRRILTIRGAGYLFASDSNLGS